MLKYIKKIKEFKNNFNQEIDLIKNQFKTSF
jgi:hypothetical protein